MVVAGDEGRWRLGEQQASKQDHEGRDGSNGQGYPPAVLIDLDSAVIDQLGNDDSNGGAPLEQQVQHASVLGRRHLGRVDGHGLQCMRKCEVVTVQICKAQLTLGVDYFLVMSC